MALGVGFAELVQFGALKGGERPLRGHRGELAFAERAGREAAQGRGDGAGGFHGVRRRWRGGSSIP